MKALLTPRLLAVADYVMKGAAVIDVGTDHAYLPVFLCLKEIADRALAADIKPGPLNAAVKTIRQYGLQDKIKTVLTDGLKNIPADSFDTVVAAGMGGRLISRILRDAPRGKSLILQPMTAVEELRDFLYENDYEIVCERLVSEGEKLYTVIAARDGMQDYGFLDRYVGRFLIENRDPLLPAYTKKLKARCRKILSGMERAAKPNEELAEHYRRLLSELNRL